MIGRDRLSVAGGGTAELTLTVDAMYARMQTSDIDLQGVHPAMIMVGSSGTTRHQTTGTDGTDRDLRSLDQHGVVRMLKR